MKVYYIHVFEGLSKHECINLQKELALKIELKPLNKSIRYIAGVDLSFFNEDSGLAVVVIYDMKTSREIEVQYHVGKINFPYIPGLLAFREVPLFLKAWEKINTEPDLVMFDGQGIAHPRRMGLASHGSLFIKKPSIGVAKSKLFGIYEEPGEKKGDYTYLFDNDGNKIGAVVRTKDNTKPLFVSPGNWITIEESVKYVLKTAIKYKLPEPTRLAHNYTQSI